MVFLGFFPQWVWSSCDMQCHPSHLFQNLQKLKYCGYLQWKLNFLWHHLPLEIGLLRIKTYHYRLWNVSVGLVTIRHFPLSYTVIWLLWTQKYRSIYIAVLYTHGHWLPLFLVLEVNGKCLYLKQFFLDFTPVAVYFTWDDSSCPMTWMAWMIYNNLLR